MCVWEPVGPHHRIHHPLLEQATKGPECVCAHVWLNMCMCVYVCMYVCICMYVCLYVGRDVITCADVCGDVFWESMGPPGVLLSSKIVRVCGVYEGIQCR
jgi:hypothetical protein